MGRVHINDFEEFDNLIKDLDDEKAIKYFSKDSNVTIKPYEARAKAENLIRNFVIDGDITLSE